MRQQKKYAAKHISLFEMYVKVKSSFISICADHVNKSQLLTMNKGSTVFFKMQQRDSQLINL